MKPKRQNLNRIQRQVAEKLNTLKGYIHSKRGTDYPINKYEHYKMRISVLEYRKNEVKQNGFEQIPATKC